MDAACLCMMHAFIQKTVYQCLSRWQQQHADHSISQLMWLLQACHGSLERAADWLFSHADDLDAVSGAAAPEAATSTQGEL